MLKKLLITTQIQYFYFYFKTGFNYFFLLQHLVVQAILPAANCFICIYWFQVSTVLQKIFLPISGNSIILKYSRVTFDLLLQFEEIRSWSASIARTNIFWGYFSELFDKFKNCEFAVVNKEPRGKSKVYDDAELGA